MNNEQWYFAYDYLSHQEQFRYVKLINAVMNGIYSAATMYGNTEMYGNVKKCTEMYGWKVGVLSVQKYVRMYGILEKNWIL